MSFIAAYGQRVIHRIQHFDGDHARDFLDSYPDYPVYATVLYLLAVFYLPSWMKKHNKVYELKLVVALWNLFFSVVSTIGAYYGINALIMLVDFQGLPNSFCRLPNYSGTDSQLLRFTRDLHEKDNAWRETPGSLELEISGPPELQELFIGPTAFFMALFAYLKTPELMDTIFLILQGKPVSFLHWYHHILTAVYCWHSGYVLIPGGIFFATINYFVHSIMYFYYFLVVMGLRSTIRPFAPVITILQVLQMFAGMGITVYTYLQYWLAPAMSHTLFYAFFRAIFSAAHYGRVQTASVLRGSGWVARAEVPSFHMADHFQGCQSDTTNMRMGMMMYGSYCVLFAVLFKELYLDKRASKRSLVLARRQEAANGTNSKPSPPRAHKSGSNGKSQA